jgi:hypothetical protein
MGIVLGGRGVTAMRFWAVLAFAALLAVPCRAETEAQPPATMDQEVQLLGDGTKAYDAEDWAKATRLLKQGVESNLFFGIKDEGRQLIQRLLADAAHKAEDYQTSARAARAACEFADANATDWNTRFWASLAVGDNVDTIISLTMIAEKWPDRLADFDFQAVHQTVFMVESKATADELQNKLLRALYAAHWKPRDTPASDADTLWLKLLRFDLMWNNQAEAKEIASHITNPGVVVEMRGEKLFDALTSADPERYDIEKAYAAALQRALQRKDDNPNLLEPLVDAANYLYLFDRQDEALALLDAALARINSGSKAAVFKDQDEQLNWLHDRRSQVLLAMGRSDEALAEMEAGAQVRENGDINVSQTINLAGFYDELGRPSDALATLARLDPYHTSPYGRLAYEVRRACSYAQLGDTAKLAESLKFLEENAGDSPRLVFVAAICAGDMEHAAGVIIRLLNDPRKRSDVLMSLQDHASPKKSKATADSELRDKRLHELLARRDVQEAIATFGRILTLPVL